MLVTYDTANRVAEEAYRAPDGSVVENLRYAYDLDGNRTSRIVERPSPSGLITTTETYTYAPGDELVSVTTDGTPMSTFTYDASGRTTSIARGGHTQSLTYDADDRLTRVVEGTAETRFVFDAEGHRIGREDWSAGSLEQAHEYAVGPTYDAGLASPHLVTRTGGAEELGYVFAPVPGAEESALFRYDPVTSEAVYYLHDAMGSVVGLVDSAATHSATFDCDGFGAIRSQTGSLASVLVTARGDFRFHGNWRDTGTGLDCVRARTYDPATGRFLTRDPAEGRRDQPESFEGTRAFLGNPYVGRDPTGTVSTSLGDLFAGVRANAVLVGTSVARLSRSAIVGVRVSATVLRGFRFVGLVRNLRIAQLTTFQLREAFASVGLRATNHFLMRIAHPRTAALGWSTLRTVEAIFRYGRVEEANNGLMALVHDGMAIVFNPTTGTLVTLTPW